MLAASEAEQAMTYKDLLVHVDATPQGLARLTLAANLAEAYGGYLTGLFLKPPPTPPSVLAVATGAHAGAYEAVPDPDPSSRQLAEATARAAMNSEAAFRTELERAGAKGEWHVIEAPSLRAILPRAGLADLVMLGQVNPSAGEDTTDLPAEIALACGRPVLVVPYAGEFPAVGDRIMIAWNAGRELIRAVNDALPFLKRARFVVLFAINHKEGDRNAGPEALDGIARHLAHHGIEAERYAMTASDGDVGGALLSRAANFDCDLMVMGAYGHPRLREIIFGGATHTVLRTMNVPILMSH